MPLKFFIIPVRDLVNAENALNAFLSNHAVISIERKWIDEGWNSFWSICVDYLVLGSELPKDRLKNSNRSRIDYREVLSADEFSLFAKLRDWRKEVAQQESVPVYTVFTNEQLAQMILQRISNKDSLSKIEGVGASRSEKYADQILAILVFAQAAKPLVSGEQSSS